MRAPLKTAALAGWAPSINIIIFIIIIIIIIIIILGSSVEVFKLIDSVFFSCVCVCVK